MADKEEEGKAMERFSPPSAEFWSLWHTGGHSAVRSQNAACVLAQSRAVVAGADRETGVVFSGLVIAGSGDWISSGSSQSIIVAIEQLYLYHQQHYCIEICMSFRTVKAYV